MAPDSAARRTSSVSYTHLYWVGDRFVNAIDGFLDTQVDGLLIAAEPGRDFKPLGIPTVVEGRRQNGVAGADSVISDQELGVGLVMRHLQSLGHRRIGHVTGVGGSALSLSLIHI